MKLQHPKKASFFVDIIRTLIKSGMGFVFLSIFSQWQLFIPSQAVPYTLQSLVLCSMAYFLTPKEVLLSVGFYILGCSLGLPILSGGVSNAAWLSSFLSGYMLAVPLAVWILSRIFTVYDPLGFVSKIFIFFVGHVVILLGGALRLSLVFPLKTAFHQGMLVFLGSSLVKSIVAGVFAEAYERIKYRYMHRRA